MLDGKWVEQPLAQWSQPSGLGFPHSGTCQDQSVVSVPVGFPGLLLPSKGSLVLAFHPRTDRLESTPCPYGTMIRGA